MLHTGPPSDGVDVMMGRVEAPPSYGDIEHTLYDESDQEEEEQGPGQRRGRCVKVHAVAV